MIFCRRACEADLPAVRVIDQACATRPEEAAVLAEPGVGEFFLGRGGLFVAESQQQVVGFALVELFPRMHGGRNLLWIEHIAVAPVARRQGVGLALLRQLQREFAGHASTLHATIHPHNAASLRLFRAAGAELSERVLAYVPAEGPAGRSAAR